MAQAPKKSASKKNAKTLNFHQQLVTNQWLLNFFNPNDLTGLKNRLEHPKFEGIDEDIQYLYKLIEELKKDIKAGVLSQQEVRSRLEEVEAIAKRLSMNARTA